MDSILTSAQRQLAAARRTQVQSADGDIDLEHEVLNRLSEPEISPLLVESFEDLPNTYVVTAGLDVLRDDGLLFVRRMRQWSRTTNATAPKVGYKNYANYSHVFMTFSSSNELQRDLAVFLSNHPDFF